MNVHPRKLISITFLTLVFFYGFTLLSGFDSANDALQPASVINSRQLTTALELYYVEHGYYPRVEDDDLIIELQKEGLLSSSYPNVATGYVSVRGGQHYEFRE